jgi:hypothetical protein
MIILKDLSIQWVIHFNLLKDLNNIISLSGLVNQKAAYIEYNMVFWKEKNIKWPMERIKYYNKEIEKLQKKLNALV